MKKIIFYILISLGAFAQKTGKVSYGFINALDIGGAKGIDYNAILLFDNKLSHYITAKDSLEKEEDKFSKREFVEEETNAVSVYEGMSLSKSGNEVVNSLSKQTLWSSFLNNKMIYSKEVTPKINWTLLDEIKTIGGFECKKAVCFFRGRNFEAWYSTKIPLPFGPWKLNGLPGLILEASDKGKNVVWYYKSLQYPAKNNEKVNYMMIPINAKVMNFDELFIYQINFMKKLDDIAKVMKKEKGFDIQMNSMSQTFIECEK